MFYELIKIYLNKLSLGWRVLPGYCRGPKGPSSPASPAWPPSPPHQAYGPSTTEPAPWAGQDLAPMVAAVGPALSMALGLATGALHNRRTLEPTLGGS